MSSGYFNAIRLLLRAHRRSSLLSHAHIVGRFLTCPFLRVIDLLPDRCRLLDIGAGHGTFARLALAAGAAEAVALEPDLQKSLQSAGGDGLRLVTGFAGAVRGTFDVVSMIDVLYRIPHGEWDDLFALIYSHVSPGGIFLLKEIDPEAPLKAAWNKAQERLADRLLHLTTIGNHHDYESRAALQARLERAGFTSFEVHELGAGYPHAHIAYLARRS
ncbi:MAG TPA: methyltransferase domain-containing protein [Thermoanaerobaculia bacterium]|nr:methyltransferase domain-containing protein [Thermoanaerobaculia bacterium]